MSTDVENYYLAKHTATLGLPGNSSRMEGRTTSVMVRRCDTVECPDEDLQDEACYIRIFWHAPGHHHCSYFLDSAIARRREAPQRGAFSIALSALCRPKTFCKGSVAGKVNVLIWFKRSYGVAHCNFCSPDQCTVSSRMRLEALCSCRHLPGSLKYN